MTALFPSAFEAVVFWVILLSVIILNTLIEGRGASKFKKSQKASGDEYTTIVARVAMLFSLGFGLLLGYSRLAVLPDWLFYLGLVIFILGFAFSSWSVFTLGRFYSPSVGVQADHRVVDKGPYHLIRHPRYAGGLLMYLGLGLALQSLAAILVLVIGLGLGYAYRIRVEEKFMIAQLGNEYVEYCKRTKRIIPFIF